MGWVDNPKGPGAFVRYASRKTIRDRKNNCNACHEFGSAHYTNWNVAMADGSVRTINYNLDLEIHRASASIKGHETRLIP